MGHYQNTFDQIHMSAACQARILEAASSAETQEEQTAMRKSKNVLKTMLLAAALATCLSAVAYASSNILPEQLTLSKIAQSDTAGNFQRSEGKQGKDGAVSYVLEEGGEEATITEDEAAAKASHLKVSAQKSGEEYLLVVSDDNSK